jgi:hypothetical protein
LGIIVDLEVGCSSGGQATPLAGVLFVLITAVAGFGAANVIGSEVSQSDDNQARVVPASERPDSANEVYRDAGRPPDSYTGGCPSLAEAEGVLDLRRRGLTKIAAGIRARDPNDPQLERIEAELDQLGPGPSD